MRERVPGFCFMAEVYWDLEWTMLQQGFDYAYDKRLYDRLREGHARPVREHLHAGLDYQNKLARFLENHDEPRAAADASRPACTRPPPIITYLSPGLRFFHQGQLEGRRKRISPHLVRAPAEPVDESAPAVLRRSPGGAAGSPAFRDGQWRLLECAPAWDGNGTSDGFICLVLAAAGTASACWSTVNYAANQGPVLRPPAVRRAARVVRCGCGIG